MENDFLADLDNHVIKITSNFSGGNILLFGQKNKDTDIIAVIKGPEQNFQLIEKTTFLNIFWLNNNIIKLPALPSVFKVYATRPLEQILPTELIDLYKLNSNFIVNEKLIYYDQWSPEQRKKVNAHAIRLFQKKNHYTSDNRIISSMKDQLFRTTIHLPDTSPQGSYIITIYLVKNNHIIKAQITPLTIQKVELSEYIFNLSKNFSYLYASFTLIIMIFLGWLSNKLIKHFIS